MYQCIVDHDARLRDALSRACSEARAGAVALSGGLDSTIISHLMRDRRPAGIAVISRDFVATDTVYCQAAAAAAGMRLHTVMPDAGDLLGYVPNTVRMLGCFADTAVRNALVMYAAISEAKRLGMESLATGDGADELFAGYGFLAKMEGGALRAELDRLRGIMRFSSHVIGEQMGVRIESPFLHPDVMRVASALPPHLLVGRRGDAPTGKWILRRMFAGDIPDMIAWRPKSPMQDGAGTAGLTGLLDSVIPDDSFAERVMIVASRDGIRIRTKESLYYYEQYVKCFGAPKPADGGRACPHCRCAVPSGLRSCRMCGAFPVP